MKAFYSFQFKVRATISAFEELKVYKKAGELCSKIHYLIHRDKFAKDYALKDQINRSSGALMYCIAEGFGREGANEFIHAPKNASGAALEVKSQLNRALEGNYLAPLKFANPVEIVDEGNKMLFSLIAYLHKADVRGSKATDETP